MPSSEPQPPVDVTISAAPVAASARTATMSARRPVVVWQRPQGHWRRASVPLMPLPAIGPCRHVWQRGTRRSCNRCYRSSTRARGLHRSGRSSVSGRVRSGRHDRHAVTLGRLYGWRATAPRRPQYGHSRCSPFCVGFGCELATATLEGFDGGAGKLDFVVFGPVLKGRNVAVGNHPVDSFGISAQQS